MNSFRPNFVGSDLIAISKPPTGTSCPDEASFKVGTQLDLRDTSNDQVFTPVPSNQVDNNGTGYVVARHGSLPANKLWFFNVRRDGTTGQRALGTARALTVTSYTMPPSAVQPTFTQLLDTLDARHTQAVQAINSDRINTHSFWVQHTIKHASENRSVVRFGTRSILLRPPRSCCARVKSATPPLTPSSSTQLSRPIAARTVGPCNSAIIL